MRSGQKSLATQDERQNWFPVTTTNVGDQQRIQDSIQIWAWLNQGHFSEKTKQIYSRIIKDFFFTYPSLELKTTLASIVTLYLRSKSDLQASSRNLYRNALSSLFQYLENTDYIKKNPVKVTKKEKVVDEFYFKVLSLEQISRMLKFVNSDRDRLAIEVLYYTGLRVSELTMIQIKDFSGAHGLDTVSKHYRNKGAQPKKMKLQKKAKSLKIKYLAVKGKGGRVRTILTGDALANRVSRYIRKNGLASQDFLLTGSDRPLSRIRVYTIIKKLCERAGIETPGDKSPSPHWFRHTSAIHALDNGADIQVVQSTLGHASLATTGRYLKSRPIKSNASYLSKIQK